MSKKQKNIKEIAYFREINEERKKVNQKLTDTLKDIVRSGESLSEYQLWVNKKCEIMIQPEYIIEKVSKDLEKEGFEADIAYVIVKKATEEGKRKSETSKL